MQAMTEAPTATRPAGATPDARAPRSGERMPCMEVWGGNRAVDSGVIMPGLDAWVYSQPFDQADGGGDVHYVSSCATGRIIRLLVADVSGHGSGVADVADRLRDLMRQYINYIDQQRFVAQMNRQFKAASEAGSFATSVVGTFFGPTRDLTICNAGHPPPLLYSARRRQWSALQQQQRDPQSESPSNLPLGVLDLSAYEQFETSLSVGDLVLFYSDSLIESRGRDGNMLGTKGLLEVARRLDVTDPSTFVRRLIDEVRSLSPGNLEHDDVTVLLVRPNGVGGTVGDRVHGMARMAAQLMASMTRGVRRAPWPEPSLVSLAGAFIGPINRLRKRRTPRPAE